MPEEYYRQVLTEYQYTKATTERIRNWITGGKLIAFTGFCVSVYYFATLVEGRILLLTFGCLIGFILLSLWDVKVIKSIKICRSVISCCETELQYLSGNYSGLDTGKDYELENHPYALDLDILGDNSLFQHLNRTVTIGGRNQLSEWILSLSKKREEITERQEAVKELSERPEWCGKFLVKGKMYALHEDKSLDLQSWLNASAYFSGKAVWFGIYSANLLTLLLWIAAFCSWVPYIFALAASFLQLGWVVSHNKKMNVYNEQLSSFLKVANVYFHLIRHMTYADFKCERLNRLKGQLSGEKQDALKAFADLKNNLNRFEYRGNFLVSGFLNGLWMDSFYAVRRLEHWKSVYGKSVSGWMQIVHQMDALVSMSVYRFNHPDYVVPVLKDDKWLYAVGIGHPLLCKDSCVRNDFEVQNMNEFYVITGANMAGKSTFLRTVGVNLVLALSGNVVCSQKFELALMDLFTSMRTTDNLSKGTSYFHAELLRLKQLIEQAESSEKLFIILDEMLKGTNSQDKLNGSLKFLKHLLGYTVSGIVATHDLALGELAAQYPDHFFNSCFEITHTADEIYYDYKLKPGISHNMNASVLLQKMGLIE